MSEQTIAEKSLEIRQETQEFANTRGRVANVLDDINTTKANKSDVAQSLIDQNQNLQNHINDQANPHNVTKSQIGLGNVDNTSDVDKPISIATQAAITNLSTSTTTALGNKVDKTTTTITAPDATFKYAYIFDENNNVRRMLAGDLGKNVANSALTSVANAGLTLGANWALNTSGFYYSITGLNDASNDSTFNTLLTQNSAGRVAKSNGKTVFMSLPTFLTDNEKTTWKTVMNGGWTTATMSVAMISPPLIDQTQNQPSWITLKGTNLNLNPTSFSVELFNVDTNTYTLVPASQVQLYTSGIDLIFWFNFNTIPVGNYKIRLWNGVAYYTTPMAIKSLSNLVPIDMTTIIWTALKEDGSSTAGSYGNNGYGTIAPGGIWTALRSSTLFAQDEDFSLSFKINSQLSPSNLNNCAGIISGLIPISTVNNFTIEWRYLDISSWGGAGPVSLNGNQAGDGNTNFTDTVYITRQGTLYNVMVIKGNGTVYYFNTTAPAIPVTLGLLGKAGTLTLTIQQIYSLN